MDELRILRALLAEETPADAEARAEVWRRLERKRRRQFGWTVQRWVGVVGVGVMGIALVGTALTLRSGSIGVATAEAACATSGPAAPCLEALAKLDAGDIASSRVVYQRKVTFGRALRPAAPHVARPFTVQQAQTVELWVDRVTLRGALRAGDAHMFFPTTGDRAAWQASGSPTWRRLFGAQLGAARTWTGRRTNWFYNCNLRTAQRAISTDSARVIELLRSIAAKRGDVSNWGAYYGSLCDKNPLLTPMQRAAIFQALARSPSVHLVGLMRDPLGREGVAITSTLDGRWNWLSVYNPRTGRLLAEGFPPRLGAPLSQVVWVWAFTVNGAPAARLLRTPQG